MPRQWRDRLAALVMKGLALVCVGLALSISIALLAKSWPVITTSGLRQLLLGSSWHPRQGAFGCYPFLIGTLWVSGLAMALSIPICLLCALYLSEHARSRLRAAAKPMLDLLAGIPSVVFGLWGMLAVVPVVRWLGWRAGVATTGYSVLAGGVVLAIMVFPIIISVAEEVLRKVPLEAREASLALGATRWQTTKHVVVRAALPGIIAAIILGFTRAFGETMAVLMVVGNVARLPRSLFDPAYPLPALIANNYGEMMSVPRYDAALMFAALMLLAVVLGFNIMAALVLRALERRLA